LPRGGQRPRWACGAPRARALHRGVRDRLRPDGDRSIRPATQPSWRARSRTARVTDDVRDAARVVGLPFERSA
jgi:hypothetical protein